MWFDERECEIIRIAIHAYMTKLMTFGLPKGEVREHIGNILEECGKIYSKCNNADD